MRRASAALLIALINSFWIYCALIGPLLSADANSNLPACCRKNGKHRCAMVDDTAGHSWESTRCPLFPASGAALISERTGTPQAFGSLASSLASNHEVRPQTRAPYHICLYRIGQKRGPPATPTVQPIA
jgi:hypothetical protein